MLGNTLHWCSPLVSEQTGRSECRPLWDWSLVYWIGLNNQWVKSRRLHPSFYTVSGADALLETSRWTEFSLSMFTVTSASRGPRWGSCPCTRPSSFSQHCPVCSPGGRWENHRGDLANTKMRREILMKTGAVPTPPVIMNFLRPPAELPPSPLSHVGDGVSIYRNRRELLQLQPQRKQRRLGRKGFIPLCNEASSETSTSNMRSSSSRSHDSRLFRRSCRGVDFECWVLFCFFLQEAVNASAAAGSRASFKVNLLLLLKNLCCISWLTHTSLPVTAHDHFKHADQKYIPGQSAALTR